MLKILFIASADNAHTYRWATFLIQRGNTVKIFSKVDGDIPGAEIILSGEDVQEKRYIVDWNIFYVYKKFKNILAEYRPDIVHMHYLKFHWANLFFYNNINNFVVSVWGSDIIRDDGKENYLMKISKYLLLKKAIAICATSKFLSEETKYYLHKGRHIHIIPFGVDLNKLRCGRRKSIDKVVRIGFVKHLLPKYGPKILLEAFRILANKFDNIKLSYVGKGYLLNDLSNLANRYSLKSKVEFLGAIHHH